MMPRPPNHAEVTAERIERIFADIPDSIVRYQALAELLLDYADAIRGKTVADLLGGKQGEAVMSFCPERLLQEVAAAASKGEIETIVDAHRDDLAALKPAAKEKLLCAISDLYAELPDGRE